MSSFWRSQPLQKLVQHEVDYHRVDKKMVRPEKRLNIQEANDQFFVTNVTEALNIFWIYFGLCIAAIVFVFTTSDGSDKKDELLSYLLISLPFFILALFHLIVYFVAPNKEVVLDRLNSKISYPRKYAKSEHRTIQFDSLHVYETMTSSGDFSVTGKNIYIKDSKYSYQWDLGSSRPNEYWSFMVWYMDKNRPLPPGTAFDKYRQGDFERRKSEGFPKPLYPSNIPTPEATSKQQKERKEIGGW